MSDNITEQDTNNIPIMIHNFFIIFTTGLVPVVVYIPRDAICCSDGPIISSGLSGCSVLVLADGNIPSIAILV